MSDLKYNEKVITHVFQTEDCGVSPELKWMKALYGRSSRWFSFNGGLDEKRESRIRLIINSWIDLTKPEENPYSECLWKE